MERKKYHPNYWADIPNEWKETIDRLYLEEYNSDRRETRRHQSLDKSLEHGWDLPDPKVNIEDEAEHHEVSERLHKAIEKLKQQQQELIFSVYFNYEKMSDIACEEGVDNSSVRHRMQRSIKMLKKLLEQTATFADSRGY